MGFGTTVTGKYEIGNGISGRRNEASIGLKNTTKITDDLTSELSYEKTKELNQNVLETSTPDHNAFSLGFEYLPKASYKATIKGEIASDGQSTKRDLTFGGDLRLARDFTLIDKLTYYEEVRSQTQDQDEQLCRRNVDRRPGESYRVAAFRRSIEELPQHYRDRLSTGRVGLA